MDAFDDDTYDFVHLWDFAQGWRHFHIAISPDDIALLDQLVECQNFSVALDLLQMRMGKYDATLPHEIRKLTRKRRKCIKVRDTSAFESTMPPPTLKDFHARAVDYLAPPLTDTDIAEIECAESPPPPPHISNDDSASVIRQQDEEYEAALALDMAKQCTPWIHATKVVVPEPCEDDSGSLTVVVVLSPNGTRFERRFFGTSTLEDVASWLSLVANVRLPLNFFTNFPRTYWPPETRLADTPMERKRLLLFAEIAKD